MSEAKRLGRGLEALLGPVSREQAAASGALRELPVTAVRPNPFQPRTHFDPAELTDLTRSIEASGLLQPIVVRAAAGGTYELIAGERRLRAVQQLGWASVPAVVKEADDRTLLTLALVENLQRDDLSPIDEAVGYQRLLDEFAVPHQELARIVGRDRSTVANTLRLLKLPEAVRALVHAKKLTEGHARALLALNTAKAQETLLNQIVNIDMSVRQTEMLVRKYSGQKPVSKKKTASSADVNDLEKRLRSSLGTKVALKYGKRGGTVTIYYYSDEELDSLLEKLT